MVVSRLLRVSESIVYAELEGEAVLLNVDSGTYFGLNEIGTEIWKRSEQGFTLEEIIEQLCCEYDAERSVLTNDVDRFVVALTEHGLVRRADDRRE